jgi:hypothetical protein
MVVRMFSLKFRIAAAPGTVAVQYLQGRFGRKTPFVRYLHRATDLPAKIVISHHYLQGCYVVSADSIYGSAADKLRYLMALLSVAQSCVI